MRARNRAVFFDRDGTLCHDADYLNTWHDFKVFDDISHLNSLILHEFMLIGLTNQSGIARGLVEESFAREVNRHFITHHGFADFYYCPHHPDEGCGCRKPGTGMLTRAATEHHVDPKRSYVVGDKDSDMLLAKAVGAKAVLVQTGKQQESAHADFIAKDLEEAVQLILDDSKKRSPSKEPHREA
jgi:heptosyltransferase-2